MKKHSEHPLFHSENSPIKYVAPLLAAIILLAAVLGALILNTMGLHKALRQNTIDYRRDVSTHLASNIAYRMETREVYIRNLADTFSGMPDFLLTEELLNRKAAYLEMKDIFVVKADGTTIPADEEHADTIQYLSGRPELYTEPMIFFAGNGEVFFSRPYYPKGRRKPICSWGSGLTHCSSKCSRKQILRIRGSVAIADKDGTIIVSATDEAPFLELNDVFAEAATTEDDTEVHRVLADIHALRSGVARFNSLGKEPILLGYSFLGINDWMLLTLLPSDLFGESTTPYLIRYIVIIGLLFLLMLAILFFVIMYYRRTLGYIQSIALTDPLTGGHNVLAFRLCCEKLFREEPEQAYAIIYLNIRDFKHFNEHYGTQHGDALLRQIFRLLQKQLLAGELICRSSGDHFYLLLLGKDENSVRHRLQDMLNELERQLGPAVFL